MIECGSTNYPVRNLLSEMNTKSLNVFNNIQTNDGYMMCGFTTHCVKDYDNLFKIYFDSLINPLMREEDFHSMVQRYTW